VPFRFETLIFAARTAFSSDGRDCRRHLMEVFMFRTMIVTMATAGALGVAGLAATPASAAPIGTAPIASAPAVTSEGMVQQAQYYYGPRRYYGPPRYYGRPYYAPR